VGQGEFDSNVTASSSEGAYSLPFRLFDDRQEPCARCTSIDLDKAFKRIFKRISAALIMDLGQVDETRRTSRRTMLRHAPTKGCLI
jgi:hypothetical protein